MKILVMGGTRFIGISLTKLLLAQGHEVTLFNRGNRPAPANVKVILGDRSDPNQLKQKLSDQQFDAIFDNNGRELSDTQPLVDIFRGRIRHFVYMSSAGVYLESETLPYFENDATDPKSRHRGKLDTEAYLTQAYQEHGFPFTSIRPTYIYGAGNYNDLEAWFFDRIVRDRPIPIPGNGKHITQLGHVEDLAAAMVAVLGNRKAVGEIYNISDARYITFTGLAQQCAIAVGKPADLVYYQPEKFNFGKQKPFPLRMQHFFTSIEKAIANLDWEPEIDLGNGLESAFHQDYLANHRDQQTVDLSLDDQILASL